MDKKFLTLESVSLSNLDTLLKFWEGLGYYKRCINFYNASKIIVNDFSGKIPCGKERFLSLPGVGEYTLLQRCQLHLINLSQF